MTLAFLHPSCAPHRSPGAFFAPLEHLGWQFRSLEMLPRASVQPACASPDFSEDHQGSPQRQRDAWLRCLHKGQWVVLCGLVSRPDLNGVDARLLKEVPSVGRWALHVLHTSERFRVKYANIFPQWTLPVPPSALPPTDFQQPIRRKLASCDFTVGHDAQSTQNRISADSHLRHPAHSGSCCIGARTGRFAWRDKGQALRA